MTIRLVALSLIVAWACTAAVAGEADNRDTIFRKNGTRIAAFVESENVNEVLYRTIKLDSGIQTQPNKMKLSELDHIVYNGMDGGFWNKGWSERNAGNYEAAADLFNQLATSGAREWEKVYGAIAEGESWELAGKYSDAAKAYALVVNGFAGNPKSSPPLPAHRLWLNTKYHLGMVQALGKTTPDATKTADELEALGKTGGLIGAESRASAIRSAIAAADGNFAKFTEYSKKTNFSSFDEKEVWFHFKLFSADTLRMSFKKGKEAASIYREILSGLGNDSARQAQVSLGLGICLIDGDRQGALIELLKLDLMPYGSADQKCEARFNAGRLLWDEAQTIKNNAEAMKDERKSAFVKETERAARLVVAAAADGPAKNPNVALAKSLLSSFGPDPDAPKDAKKDAKDAGAAQPPAAK